MSKQETWPRKADSSSYLEHHKLIPLFQNVTAHILYDQPGEFYFISSHFTLLYFSMVNFILICLENPRDYMIEYLKKLQEAKRTKRNYPSLFDETHLRSVFLLLDPAETGRINLEQYKQGI